MKKKITFLLLMFVLAVVSAYAQGGGARQQVQLQLNPAIEISSRNSLDISATGSEFHIRANKEFNVSVSTEDPGDELLLAIANNETGGIATGYSAYAPVSSSAQGLFTNCAYGNDRSFAVNCKAGKNKGTTLVYTATLP